MQLSDKKKFLNMIEEGIFDFDLLVKCIAKLNGKITRKCQNVQHAKALLDWAGHEAFYEESKEELSELISYRKPILDILMKSYHISLDELKTRTKEINYDDLPTYAMIASVRKRILSGVFICV